MRSAHVINVFLFLPGPHNFGKGSEWIESGESWRWMANAVPEESSQGFPSCSHPLTRFAVESLAHLQSSRDWIALKSITSQRVSPPTITHTYNLKQFSSLLFWIEMIAHWRMLFLCIIKTLILIIIKNWKLTTRYKTLKWSGRLPMQSFKKRDF